MSMSADVSSLTTESSIYVAGHCGMVGSAMVRLLQKKGYNNLLTRTSGDLDLTDQAAVRAFFANNKIDYVVLAAAKVGGIHANDRYPADFIYKNLMIQANVINEAYLAGVEDLLFLGSSCIYPKFCKQPMSEEYLLTDVLEPTNEPYAVAKIAGIKMCESYNRQYLTRYRAVMPTNLYGPGDNYHLENSHVVPAMIRKYHLAKLAAAKDLDAIDRDEKVFGAIPEEVIRSLSPVDNTDVYVQLWGSGTARREFLHADDMAAACFLVMRMSQEAYSRALISDEPWQSATKPCFLNIGTGRDCTIKQVADMIKEIVGFTGETRYNSDQPDGTPQKLLDTSRINTLGWSPEYTLTAGLRDTYKWYCQKLESEA